MRFPMLFLGENLEVLRVVVLWVAVFVMYDKNAYGMCPAVLLRADPSKPDDAFCFNRRESGH